MNPLFHNSVTVIVGASLLGTLAWLFVWSRKNQAMQARLLIKITLTLIALYFEFTVAKPAFAQGGGTAMTGLVLTMVFAIGLNILWRNALSDLISHPLTSLFNGGNEPPRKQPYYSAATAQRKQGHYLEAIDAIQEQLELFPHDFEGTLLLASIQAENLKDLPAAEFTLNRFCNRAQVPVYQMAGALTQLADWHIKIVDWHSARGIFQRIIRQFPNTESAGQAELRIAHLVGSGEIFTAQPDRPRIVLRTGMQNIGLLDSTKFLQPPAIDPVELVAAQLAHLQAHPHDTEAREQLAMIYANDLKQLDLALAELLHLINGSNHKPKQVAHWLNLAATFQVKLGADVAAVQATLEKIQAKFPGLPVAEVAKQRLARLNNEFRGRQKTAVIKLGVYEQNIGLKCGAPGKP